MKRPFLCTAILSCALLLPLFSLTAAEASDKASGNIRYAVCLLGIRQDTCSLDDREQAAGLSFGPALGEDYLNSFKAHVSQDAYLADPVKNRCLHWMSWEEIAAQSLRDPEVFRPCLENRCTHAVELTLNDTLSPLQKEYPMSGDGASCLQVSLRSGCRHWNHAFDITGGWPASRIRATLNGLDDKTEVRLAGKDCPTAETCLLSCFPPALQESIVPRLVVSDLSYDRKKSDCVTTWDRLFLFSACEIHGTMGRSKPSEGTQYESFALHPPSAGHLPEDYRFFTEKGVVDFAWLRSSSWNTDVINYCITGPGHTIEGNRFRDYAIAPGFCLP